MSRPTTPAGRATAARLAAGTALPAWELPLTPTLVVSTALATRDFQDVHHDRDAAQAAGSKDIFLNILTTTGLVERYVVDSLGHDVEVAGVALRLGAPAYPYDTLRFSGEVVSVEDGEARLAVVGAVSGGDHVTATVRLRLPGVAAPAAPGATEVAR